MTTSKDRAEMAALIDAALDDLLTMSDAELRMEALADGEDPNAVSQRLRTSMREAAAATLRQRLVVGKTKCLLKGHEPTVPRIRPSIERIKAIIQQVFQREERLGLAFRCGRQPTEADWQSLYDDLVLMGAIDPELR